MDVVFTLAVWFGLVVLVGHGLRLAQVRRGSTADATAQARPAPAPVRVDAEVIPLPHPVTASTREPVLTGGGSAPRGTQEPALTGAGSAPRG